MAVAKAKATSPYTLALTYQDAKTFGRPTTLSDPLIDRLSALIAEGHYPDTASKCLGIPDRTFYRWKALGKDHTDQDLDTAEAHLWHAIQKAESWSEVELIRDAKSGRMGWQGPMTVASRRFRDRWQDKQDENVGGPRILVQIGCAPASVSVSSVSLSPSLSPVIHSLTADSEGSEV